MSEGRPRGPHRSRAARLYASLLGLFPERFRARYGTEMVDFFEDAWAEARGLGRIRVLVKAVRDAWVEGLRERLRSRNGWTEDRHGRMGMGGLGQDVRFALRGLRRRPGFAAAAILTVALGIGAASSIFAVVDAVIFRPLPYPQSDRLVSMWTEFENQGDARFGLSLAEHYDYAEESRALEALGSYFVSEATLTGLGEARRVPLAWTWGDLYGVVGARAELGRLPGPEESRGGAAPVVVVSREFWTAALAGAPDVLGMTFELDGSTVEVIGVMDPAVRLPTTAVPIWRPIARNRADIMDRSGHMLQAIGRLAPGATLTTVRAEIDETHTRWDVAWAGQHSPGHPGHTFAVSGLHERYFGDLKDAGGLLLGAVALILVLACANVSTLLLARGEARQADLTLRRALGAGRARIARQLLVESLVLSGLGGLLGLALAGLGVDALMGLEPGNPPRGDTVGLDPRVTGFALLATLACGLVFGLLPAWRAGSAPGGGRATGPDRSLARSLSTLVVAQVAVAVVLLAGAALLTRSLGALASAESGIDTEGRLAVGVSIAPPRYPEMQDIAGFWDRLLREAEELPGVEAVAATRQLALRDGLRRELMWVEGRGAPENTDEPDPVAYQLVSPGYFDVAGVPVLEGREFTTGDGLGAPRVALVNEAAARAYWPGGSPLGGRVFPAFQDPALGWVTVVGVVADVYSEGVRNGVTPELFLPYAQAPANQRGYARAGVLVVRTAGDPFALVAPLRGVVERVDPQAPVTSVATLGQVEADARARERFLAAVLAVFAVLALVIAGTGTYGVVAYSAARRTREFGVRIALGAEGRRVVRDVLASGVRLAALGAGLGLVAAWAGAPALEGFLFGVGTRDPASVLAGPLLMAAIVLTASIVPAYRAGRTDPLAAFREDP